METTKRNPPALAVALTASPRWTARSSPWRADVHRKTWRNPARSNHKPAANNHVEEGAEAGSERAAESAAPQK